ncbi:MAG: hypothetical protein KAJ51_02610, partial [Thermoplasmata archaeon]|nr:hypothetical protein [Thermoplasmata archaeon]
MKRIISISIVISLLLLGFQMFLVVGESENDIEMYKETRGEHRGSILYVGPGQIYTKIQDAIEASKASDTIRVFGGIYNEN